jgi:hypothetical protein
MPPLLNGLLQLTLLAFLPGPQVKLNQVFNPGFAQCPSTAGGCAQENPIFQLLTQPQTNFNVAANFHRLSYAGLAPSAGFCDQSNSCNEAAWQSEWTQVINQYNTGGNGYTYDFIVSKKPKVVIPGGLIVSGIVNNGALNCTPQSPTPDYP